MKKMQWMLATSLVCGGALFSACSDDSSSSSTLEEPKPSVERTAFVENTRANLKELAENLNFNSWELANHINMDFNENVLNNPEVENAITRTLSRDIFESITDVDKKSELGKMGYKKMATVDLNKLNYSFTLQKDGTFDVKEAKNFEMILPLKNPETQKILEKSLKLTMKMGKDSFKHILKKLSTDELAVVMKVPEEISFALSIKPEGKWIDLYTGSFKNEVKMSGKSEYLDRMTSAFNATGEIKSSLEAVELASGKKMEADAASIAFAIGQDPAKHMAGAKIAFVHNKKNMLAYRIVQTRTNKNPIDFSNMANSDGIVDVFSVMTGLISDLSIDSSSLTLLDDVTIAMKVSDTGKLLKAQQELAAARRSYADEKTIENYTKQVNKLVTASITAKEVDQEIPVTFETVQFGVDFWTMPALQFNKDEGYVPLTQVLDQQSIAYCLNIIDHAAEPMQDALVVVRQLIQYFQKIAGLYDDYQLDKAND